MAARALARGEIDEVAAPAAGCRGGRHEERVTRDMPERLGLALRERGSPFLPVVDPHGGVVAHATNVATLVRVSRVDLADCCGYISPMAETKAKIKRRKPKAQVLIGDAMVCDGVGKTAEDAAEDALETLRKAGVAF